MRNPTGDGKNFILVGKNCSLTGINPTRDEKNDFLAGRNPTWDGNNYFWAGRNPTGDGRITS